jgi:hypothetical protein
MENRLMLERIVASFGGMLGGMSVFLYVLSQGHIGNN